MTDGVFPYHVSPSLVQKQITYFLTSVPGYPAKIPGPPETESGPSLAYQFFENCV
jgi:hypothetical protein